MGNKIFVNAKSTATLVIIRIEQCKPDELPTSLPGTSVEAVTFSTPGIFCRSLINGFYSIYFAAVET